MRMMMTEGNQVGKRFTPKTKIFYFVILCSAMFFFSNKNDNNNKLPLFLPPYYTSF
jgi:hypothetical protein